MSKSLSTFVKSLCCSFAVITTIVLLNTPVVYGGQSRKAVHSSDNGFSFLQDMIDLEFQQKPTDLRFKDIENEIFNKWKVLGYAGKFGKNKRSHWWCKCDCGKIRKVPTPNLLNNKSKSCGCHKNYQGTIYHKQRTFTIDTQKHNLQNINDCNVVYRTNLIDLKRKELNFNGIYAIYNNKNGKFYIGSCSSKSFLYERLNHHKNDLLNKKHTNRFLQKAFNKYSIENFQVLILEICEPIKCLEREQHYLNVLQPHYNLEKVAGSSLGRKVSDVTANKISESNKRFWSIKENREKMLISFKNRERNGR